MSSVFLNKAELLAERLNRVAGLENYHFIVDRPKDLEIQTERQLHKSTGGGVVVWRGGPNEKEDSSARIVSQYLIILQENPEVRDDGFTQDEIAQLVISAVHGWEVDPGPNSYRTRFKLLNVTPSEAEASMQLLFSSITQLPNTDIILNP